jgi:hypothetical protein
MTIALIANGLVVQIEANRFPVHPELVWLDVSAVTPPPEVGWTYDGADFAPPVAPTLTLVQQAALALSVGLTISLSGTLTLAPTLFPTDPVATGKIADVITTVTATGAFPGGATSYPMKDAANAWHVFTVSQYKSVAAAISGYVSTLVLIIDGYPQAPTTLPANSVTLTV